MVKDVEFNTLGSNFSPAEIEFLAENERIKIWPNFKMDPLHFISVCFSICHTSLVFSENLNGLRRESTDPSVLKGLRRFRYG